MVSNDSPFDLGLAAVCSGVAFSLSLPPSLSLSLSLSLYHSLSLSLSLSITLSLSLSLSLPPFHTQTQSVDIDCNLTVPNAAETTNNIFLLSTYTIKITHPHLNSIIYVFLSFALRDVTTPTCPSPTFPVADVSP